MEELQPLQGRGFEARSDQPLIGIPIKKNGAIVEMYFIDEEEVRAAMSEERVQSVLSLFGTWKDLGDWNEVMDELDRIRHEIKPTPSIDL